MLPVRPISLLDFFLWTWYYITKPKIPSIPENPSVWSNTGSPLWLTHLSQRQVLQLPVGIGEGDTCVSSQPLKQVGVGCWHGTCLSSAPPLPDLRCPCSPLWNKVKLLHLTSVKANKPGPLHLSWSLNVPRTGEKKQPACGRELPQLKGATAAQDARYTPQTESPQGPAPDLTECTEALSVPPHTKRVTKSHTFLCLLSKALVLKGSNVTSNTQALGLADTGIALAHSQLVASPRHGL